MELKTAIEILEYHQEWRLGKREDMIHEPKKLTEAFDMVLNEVKKLKEYEEKNRWIPVEEKLPPLNEQVLLLYDTDEYCVGVMTNYGFYLQPFDPIEQDFGSIYLAGTVNAWRSFL